VKVGPGDAFLLRWGRWVRQDDIGSFDTGAESAGLDNRVIPWLRERDVAIIGWETPGYMPQPPGDLPRLALHDFALTMLGVHLLDRADFDDLAQAAAERNRWEFMLNIAPLPTRSPYSTSLLSSRSSRCRYSSSISETDLIPPPQLGLASTSTIVLAGSVTCTLDPSRQTGTSPSCLLDGTVCRTNLVSPMVGYLSLGRLAVAIRTLRKICSVRSQCSAALHPAMYAGEKADDPTTQGSTYARPDRWESNGTGR